MKGIFFKSFVGGEPRLVFMLIHTRQKSNVFNSSSELQFQPKDIESIYLVFLIDVLYALKGLEKTERNRSQHAGSSTYQRDV